jgi:hypothetical protein
MRFSHIFIVTLTIFFSSKSYAEWEFITKTPKGYDFYYDNKNINASLGYVYFFGLHNSKIANNYGTKSIVSYYKLSCINLKYKSINDKMFKSSFGKGFPREINKPYENWKRANNNRFSAILKDLCILYF